uniref:Ig-like domain-containing protein n=1 Tax=Amphilophus citrinellus TaxID=61819 RepID=A0A3Q0T0L0_AMPCI
MNEVPHQIPLTVAKIGDDVNLTCTVLRAYGQISLKGQFYNSRFSATKVGNVNSLTIRNISKEDEATYLCQAGSAYVMEFIAGTVLVVNEWEKALFPMVLRQGGGVQQGRWKKKNGGGGDDWKKISAEVALQMPLIEVKVGGNVTLQCSVTEKEGKFVHWFKQAPGYMVQTVATGSYTKQTLSEPFNNDRFTVSEGQSQYFLTIRNVHKEDEASYFCQYGSKVFKNGKGRSITVFVVLLGS